MSRIAHMVILKFKPGVSDKTIDGLFLQLGELKKLIPGILRFAGGKYSSGEGMNKGFTHGFLMEFETAAARDNYLPHPEHERVKGAILPHIIDVIAFDFEL